jgi:IS30 family transposase
MQNTAINGTNYLTAPSIARDLGRNTVSIYRAIKRLRISPAFELNGFKFYSRASVAKLEKRMRRRNGTVPSRNGNGNGTHS